MILLQISYGLHIDWEKSSTSIGRKKKGKVKFPFFLKNKVSVYQRKGKRKQDIEFIKIVKLERKWRFTHSTYSIRDNWRLLGLRLGRKVKWEHNCKGGATDKRVAAGIAKRSRLASHIVSLTSVLGNDTKARLTPADHMSLLVTSARLIVEGCELMTSSQHYIM